MKRRQAGFDENRLDRDFRIEFLDQRFANDQKPSRVDLYARKDMWNFLPGLRQARGYRFANHREWFELRRLAWLWSQGRSLGCDRSIRAVVEDRQNILARYSALPATAVHRRQVDVVLFGNAPYGRHCLHATGC